MTIMFRLSLRRTLCAVILFLLLTSGLSPTAFATAYGRGNFSSCSYQKKCPTPPAPTQSTLPSGLTVSINLTDGQHIPKNGYQIVVTPLNGQGSSFQKVDFYIDGVLVQTVIPEKDGTARWLWNPERIPGTAIKLIITDTTGATSTQQFAIQLVDTVATGVSSATTDRGANTAPRGVIATIGQTINDTIQQAYSSAKTVIRDLPKPVVYGFPYALFVLLGANVILLLLQAKHELHEYGTLKRLLARERSIATAKKTLMELLAHYFRTPLTVLAGGVEMLGGQGSTLVDELQILIHRLQVTTEQLIAQARPQEEITTPVDAITVNGATLWRQPGLFLPFILIAVIIVPFNYVARNAGTLHITQINLGTQLIVYLLLALITYQVFRRLQLRRRDSQELQHVTRQEQEANHLRDQVITDATTGLTTDLVQLTQMTRQLSDSKAIKFISEGEFRFRELLSKLTLACQLKGSQSMAALEQMTVEDLLAGATRPLGEKRDKRHITIQRTGAADILVKDPELVSFVLRSILDNALAYSPDGGTIQIDVRTTIAGSILTVTDHGEGIPTEKMPLLFQPFSKAEGAEVFTHEGMGFSLYLSKLIMDYLGGAIALHSKPDEGTILTLQLPG